MRPAIPFRRVDHTCSAHRKTGASRRCSNSPRAQSKNHSGTRRSRSGGLASDRNQADAYSRPGGERRSRLFHNAGIEAAHSRSSSGRSEFQVLISGSIIVDECETSFRRKDEDWWSSEYFHESCLQYLRCRRAPAWWVKGATRLSNSRTRPHPENSGVKTD